MVEIGTVTLYREKSVVHAFSALGEEENAKDEPVLSIRSNRVTIPVKTKVQTVSVVVRGHNIPGTLRMTANVIDEIRRDPTILQDHGAMDWDSIWRRRLSKFESDYNPDNWVSVHIGGETAFLSRENDPVAEIETLAAGGEVSEAIVMEASSNVLGALEDLVVEHDSQTAFVFTPFPTYLRAAILERRERKTGSFAMSVYHPTPQKPIRMSAFMSFCADVMEALTHKSFVDRVQEMIADNTIGNTNITPALVQATRNRRRDLLQQIENFEAAHKLVYRPERPNLT
jgi:hypothetical protein